MENAFSLWARKRFLFWQHLVKSPENKYCLLPVFPNVEVSQKVWPSFICTYHAGAYPQISLSYLALHGKHTNLSWAYVYGRCHSGKFNETIYMVTAFRGFNKKLCFDITHEWSRTSTHEWSRTSTAPSAFPTGDVSGKVLSRLIITQQERIYPKSLLGFATYCVNSPAPIYWHIALCIYSMCTPGTSTDHR